MALRRCVSHLCEWVSREGSVRCAPPDNHLTKLNLFGDVANRVFRTTNGTLDSALGFVSLTLGLHLFVAGQIADGFFNGTFGFVQRAFNPVFVNHFELPFQ